MTRSAGMEGQRTHITIPSHYRHISRAREFVVSAARSVPIGEEELHDLVLATVEAVTNAIRHAKSTDVVLEISTNADHICVRIVDTGSGFEFYPEKCEFPCPEELSGRGLPLMHNLIDELTINSKPGKGTEVVLVKKFAGAANCHQTRARAANG